MLKRLRLWLRTVFLRRRLEREMQEEMALHLERATERLLARGMTEAEARRAARREFGNLDSIQEAARDARGARWVETTLADFGFGLRHFRRTPLTTLTMIVLLALGIGFSSGLFTLVYSLFYMPPPGIVRDDSLVRIRGGERNAAGFAVGREFSYPEYREYASQTGLFRAVAAWTSADVVLGVGDHQESLHSGAATYVTGDYFQVLGVRPVLGVGLPTSSGGDTATPELVGVISHVLWERHFGGTPDVIGRTLKVNDAAVTIVGVAPRRFAGARVGGSQVRVWLPLSARAWVQRSGAAALSSYDSSFLGLVARLQPGVEASRANATVAAIAARSAQQTTRPGASNAVSSDVVTLLADNYFPPSGESPSIISRAVSLSIPLLILLIMCTNVSTLLVGLALARRREIAVRLSLGAARRRIVRQLITETVLLALAAGAFGLFVIWVLVRTIGLRVPDVQLVLDWRVIAFTFGFAIATGMLFGVSPALHATRLALADVLKDSAATVVATRSRLQAGLVVAQIALTQPALLGLGLIIRNMVGDLRERPATVFSDRILELSFNTNPRYGAINQERADILQRLQARFAALPGVVAAVPLESGYGYFEVAVHAADRVTGVEYGTRLVVRTLATPPGYFSLMGIPFVRGRDFVAAEKDDRTAVVIGGDLARRLWGTADPIGRRLVNARTGLSEATQFVVVGVVDETRAGRSEMGGNQQRIFTPAMAVTGGMLIRTRGPAEPMVPVIRTVASSEAPELPLTSSRTLAAIETSQRSSIARAIAGAAASGFLGLFLSAIGLYAVVAFAVGQRIREIGIRTALGADRRQVVRMFLLRGLRLSLAGILTGVTLSVVVGRIIALAQNQDAPGGTFTLAVAVASIVTAVALFATWIPARQAARVDPLDALRAE
jgi:predicted permease